MKGFLGEGGMNKQVMDSFLIVEDEEVNDELIVWHFYSYTKLNSCFIAGLIP